MRGTLEVICGSMFSGKTEELMRRLKRAEYAKQHVLTIKHKIDVRKSQTCITSHDGKGRHAFSIDNDWSSLTKILDLANKNIDVVGIDELHFFPKKIINIILNLVANGKQVITSGLDLDFRGEPFEVVSTLMSHADDITKLKAICVCCGKQAHHSQRIINDKAAKYDDPIILVGASEFYEARCKDCFVMEKPAEKQIESSKLQEENQICQ